jgi:hypothetical protein
MPLHRRSRAAVPASASLESAPMSFAAAEAPVPMRTTLASLGSLLRHLPAVGPSPVERAYAYALPAAPAAPAAVEVRERHVFQVTASGHGEAHLVVVGQPLTPEDAAELRRAVIKAVAEGRKVRFQVDREERPGGGGGDDNFGINIQTLVKGE